MSNLGEQPVIPTPIIQIEKFLSSKHTERWCKILSPAHPGAAYWLCQEARILQEFNHQHPYVAKFIGVDVERRILVVEAPGYTLSQWLTTPTSSLDHPFQRSSDLIRLMIAVCEIAESLHRKGVVHGSLRPDAICINLDSSRHIDFTSIRLIDFSNAHSHQHPLEKPLFIDPDHKNAGYLSPAAREAIQADWQSYMRIVNETGKLGWFELSEISKGKYDTTLLSSILANRLDWHVDMHSLGYWFSQISLRRIDYFNAYHQEKLPKILKRMQKTFWKGGYRGFDALLAELRRFELDPQPALVDTVPSLGSVSSLAPTPASAYVPRSDVIASNTPDPFPPNRKDSHLSGALDAARQKAEKRQRLTTYVAIGAGVLVAFVAGLWALWTPQELTAEFTPPPAAQPAPPAAQPTPPVAAQDTPPAPPTEASAPNQPQEEPAIERATPSTDPLAELKQSADHGDAAAQLELANAYRNGKGVETNLETAAAWYRKAAEQGHAEAQATLGYLYMTGKGVERNDEQAASWHRKAAEQGNAMGQYNLGLLNLHGRGGLAQSNVKAYVWLSIAAQGGNLAARSQLSTLESQISKDELQQGRRLASVVKAKYRLE
ncbi:serine/threonine protein kinase [Chitinivorax tropicus]|uniref:Serine/threonine protein kinase n=1 Tax=Chitinivorax tropicus TaxID=714531 RepID=A0A840MMT1_9PROT|nr:Sel1-like repeat-containing protein kinase family protein [Chitinivorax tropicus]MBB5017816.1 serine/threonine protein kinase [Chitinivorax tropicus]